MTNRNRDKFRDWRLCLLHFHWSR